MDFIKEQPKVTTMMTAIKTGKTIRLWNKTTAIPSPQHPEVPLLGNNQETVHFPAVKNHLHSAAVTNHQTSANCRVKVRDNMKHLTLVARQHGS